MKPTVTAKSLRALLVATRLHVEAKGGPRSLLAELDDAIEHLVAHPMAAIDTPERVKAARLALGLTQAELADQLRLRGDNAKDTVRSWETVARDGEPKRPISGPAQVALELLLERAGLAID